MADSPETTDPAILSPAKVTDLQELLLGRSESAGDDEDVAALFASHEALRDRVAELAVVIAKATNAVLAVGGQRKALSDDIEQWQDFSNAIIDGAPEDWDDDVAQEAAIRYVRHLESEVDRLGGHRYPWVKCGRCDGTGRDLPAGVCATCHGDGGWWPPPTPELLWTGPTKTPAFGVTDKSYIALPVLDVPPGTEVAVYRVDGGS